MIDFMGVKKNQSCGILLNISQQKKFLTLAVNHFTA
jgi:hypothetical protein